MLEAPGSAIGNTIRTLAPPLRALLTSTLATGEQIVWLAQPDARQRRRKGYVAMLFGLAILASMAAAVLRVGPRALGGMVWFIGIFTLIGMLLAFAPWLMQAAAQSTLYVITAERALVLRVGKIDPIKAYPLANMDEVITRFHRNGSGDLILKVQQIVDSDGHPDTREHGFEDVRELGCAAYVLARLRDGDDAETVRRQAALWDRA